MKNTTIRISEQLLDKLKLLKKTTGSSTYEDVLKDVLHQELKKSYAFTKDGYLPIGSVVKDKEVVLVIVGIAGSKVIFDDGSYAINGGGAIYNLEYLAETTKEYKGERVGG